MLATLSGPSVHAVLISASCQSDHGSDIVSLNSGCHALEIHPAELVGPGEGLMVLQSCRPLRQKVHEIDVRALQNDAMGVA